MENRQPSKMADHVSRSREQIPDNTADARHADRVARYHDDYEGHTEDGRIQAAPHYLSQPSMPHPIVGEVSRTTQPEWKYEDGEQRSAPPMIQPEWRYRDAESRSAPRDGFEPSSQSQYAPLRSALNMVSPGREYGQQHSARRMDQSAAVYQSPNSLAHMNEAEYRRHSVQSPLVKVWVSTGPNIGYYEYRRVREEGIASGSREYHDVYEQPGYPAHPNSHGVASGVRPELQPSQDYGHRREQSAKHYEPVPAPAPARSSLVRENGSASDSTTPTLTIKKEVEHSGLTTTAHYADIETSIPAYTGTLSQLCELATTAYLKVNKNVRKGLVSSIEDFNTFISDSLSGKMEALRKVFVEKQAESETKIKELTDENQKIRGESEVKIMGLMEENRKLRGESEVKITKLTEEKGELRGESEYKIKILTEECQGLKGQVAELEAKVKAMAFERRKLDEDSKPGNKRPRPSDH